MRTASPYPWACLALLLAAPGLFAQTLEREVIASTGTEVVLGGYSFEETVGELVVESGTAGPYVVTQGFNYAYELPDGVQENIGALHFTLHPNPTRGQVMLSWSTDPGTTVDLEVRDVLGSLVFMDRAPKHWPYVLDLSSLSAGPYHVRVLTKEGNAAVGRVNKVR